MRRRVNVPVGVVCVVLREPVHQGSDATALSLEQAGRIALQKNALLKASALGVDAARSEFFPTVEQPLRPFYAAAAGGSA